MTNRTAASLLIALVAVMSACQAGTTAAPSSPTPTPGAPRPSSAAQVEIVQPKSGAKVDAATVHVVLTLRGARIVKATKQDIRPDEGHVHLYVDNHLVSMNYGLEQELPVQRGTYVLKAEFVAADHAPFSPRVWSQEVFFTVK